MRRYIGTFGQITEIAQVTVIDDTPVILFGNAVDFHGIGFINEVKQCRKRVTQADTPAASMTDIENPLQLTEEVILIIEFRIVPIERMACWRLEAAFANCRHSESPGVFCCLLMRLKNQHIRWQKQWGSDSQPNSIEEQS